MKNMKLSRMLFLALLGAWAIVLRMFDFPILPMAPFLKVDFSDLMVLIGMLTSGPIGAVVVAGVRDVSNYLMKGGEAGFPIGVIMSFIASMAMFLPTHFILTKLKNTTLNIKFILMSITLVVGLTVSMALINYYVALPWYVLVLNFPIDNLFSYLMAVIVPFNLIKGVILSVGQIMVIKTLIPLMKRRMVLHEPYLFENTKSPSIRLGQSHG